MGWKAVMLGAVGGLAGAFAMNQFQSAWWAVEKQLSSASGEQPPKEDSGDDATVRAAKAISQSVFQHELTEDEKKWAGPAVHYGLGTALGALYGGLAGKAPVTGAARAAAYGTGVWFVADEIAVPSLGLSKPPAQTPPATHVQALAAHLVYAFTLDLISGRAATQSRRSRWSRLARLGRCGR